MIGRAINLGNPVNAGHPLNRGLVTWAVPWTFVPGYGTTVLRDICGKNNGTLEGVTAWGANSGRSGLAGTLVIATNFGTDDVRFPSTDAVLPDASNATISLWHRKRDTTNRASSGFGTADGTTAGVRAGATLPYSDGTVYFDWGAGAIPSSGVDRVTAAITSDTNWHSWTFTVGGGFGMCIYRDGILIGSNAATPSRTLGIGSAWLLNYGGGATSDVVDIGEVRTYSRALSASEAMLLYQQMAIGHPDTLNRFTRRAVSFAAAAPTTKSRPMFRRSTRFITAKRY